MNDWPVPDDLAADLEDLDRARYAEMEAERDEQLDLEYSEYLNHGYLDTVVGPRQGSDAEVALAIMIVAVLLVAICALAVGAAFRLGWF